MSVPHAEVDVAYIRPVHEIELVRVALKIDFLNLDEKYCTLIDLLNSVILLYIPRPFCVSIFLQTICYLWYPRCGC
ncbi:unnamed protein product, partial [Dicrocoelium dendriticum]